MVAANVTTPTAASVTLKSIPRVPGGLPVIGHLLDMQKDFLAVIDRARDVGDIAYLQAGPRRVAIVSDPAMAQHILVDNAKSYSKQTRGYDALRKMLGNGLVTSEGSFWLRQRRISQPAFHREKLAGLSSIMQRDTDDMLARWTLDGRAFDFADEMMKLTMRIIGEALFSLDVSGDSDRAGAAITELVHQAKHRTVSLLNWPDMVPTPMNLRFQGAKTTLDALIYGVIQGRRAGEAKPDLLSMLLETIDEETGERMNDTQLRDELLTMFSAGHETTSTALAWTMYELLLHPEVDATLRAELSSVGGAPVSLEKMMRMPYLDAVLKESMRLHPPIWMVARCAEEDDVLGGYRVPRGHLVFVSQWVMHRHPKLWSDPLRFNPARFLVEDETRHKYAYFPFLGGPRKCIGDQLALLEAKIILTTLLQRARFEHVPGHQVIEDPAVSLRLLHGLQVSARPSTPPST